MDIKKIAGIAALIVVFIMGCSGTYGKVRKQTGAEEKMTLAELSNNWEDYHIYYSTRGDSRPAGIMFDPKNNDTRLVGDSWIKIADRQSLSDTIGIIQNQYDYAKVKIIEGSDRRVFGYIYYPSRGLYIPVEMVDERTLYVSSMPPHGSAP